MKEVSLAVVVGLLVSGGVFLALFNAPPVRVVLSPDLGAVSGGTFTEPVQFLDEVTLGPRNCVDSTWNPGSVVTSSPDYLTVTMPSRYKTSDLLFVSFDTSTQLLAFAATPTSTDSALVHLFQTDANLAPINLATTTVTVCYLDA